MTLEQVKAQKPTRDYDAYYAADAAGIPLISLSKRCTEPLGDDRQAGVDGEARRAVTAKPAPTAKPAAPPARR